MTQTSVHVWMKYLTTQKWKAEQQNWVSNLSPNNTLIYREILHHTNHHVKYILWCWSVREISHSGNRDQATMPGVSKVHPITPSVLKLCRITQWYLRVCVFHWAAVCVFGTLPRQPADHWISTTVTSCTVTNLVPLLHLQQLLYKHLNVF